MAKISKPGEYNIELLDATAGTVKGAIKATGATEGQRVLNVPVEMIHVLPGLNPRVMGTPSSDAHIAYLTKSILANGYDPLSTMNAFVRKIEGVDTICLRDGHHRLIAIDKANAKLPGSVVTVPVLLDETELSQAEMTIAFAEANSGLRHNPYEMAVLAKRGADAGLSKKDIASKLGVTTRYLDDLGVLYEAGDEIIDMVVTDQVSATLAIEEVKEHGWEKATKRLQKARDTAAAAGKTKVTKKALKKKAKADTSVATENENLDETDGEVAELPAEAVGYDATLVALEVLNAFATSDTVDKDQVGLIDAMMTEVIRLGGGDDLISYAVTQERYDDTGLIRLGIVEVEAETGAEAADKLSEELVAATKPKRDRKKKAPAAEKPSAAPAVDAATQSEDDAAGL